MPGITVPTNATQVTIGTDGTVSATVPGANAAQQVGQIQIASFPNGAGLQSKGDNYLLETAASGAANLGIAGQEGRVAVHLDGARIWNAHVASGVDLATYGRLADTASVCFSKGLGTPVGSVLVASAERIATARLWRKRLGGGWRLRLLKALRGVL